MKETVVKQIETYSNAILAFIVLQGITFAFSFGSNKTFTCHVQRVEWLAGSLTVVFIFIATVAIFAIIQLEKIKMKLAPEHKHIFSAIMKGKVITLFIFGLLPAFLTFKYGILADAPEICKTLIG